MNHTTCDFLSMQQAQKHIYLVKHQSQEYHVLALYTASKKRMMENLRFSLKMTDQGRWPLRTAVLMWVVKFWKEILAHL